MENKKTYARATKSDILKIVLSDVPTNQVQDVLNVIEDFQRAQLAKHPELKLLTTAVETIESYADQPAITPG